MAAKERVYVDPREYYPSKGDFVHLSNYKFDWEVKHVSYDGSTLYLRSVLGGRPAQVLSSQVLSIWRDPKAKQDVDNTQYYTDNYWEDLDDWDEEDD